MILTIQWTKVICFGEILNTKTTVIHIYLLLKFSKLVKFILVGKLRLSSGRSELNPRPAPLIFCNQMHIKFNHHCFATATTLPPWIAIINKVDLRQDALVIESKLKLIQQKDRVGKHEQ